MLMVPMIESGTLSYLKRAPAVCRVAEPSVTARQPREAVCSSFLAPPLGVHEEERKYRLGLAFVGGQAVKL
ncbi:hypothetical protein BHM03_00017384 [Ensete ventricosum]|nr:hypothetical protein BHM03_00017384 [Ensete ventricosum]